MAKLNLYPQIDKTFLDTFNLIFDKEYYFYDSENNKVELVEKHIYGFEDEELYEIIDENDDLDLSKDKIYLNITGKLYNAKYLFGNFGYVYDDALLGLGLEWKSKKSKIRHCQLLGKFNCDEAKEELVFNKNGIELSELYSDTKFEWVIFICKKGTANSLKFYANKEGLIIGRDTIWTIKGDGNSSLFPIKEINDSSQPLWKVEYSATDPFEDPFNEDYLALVLNSGHPEYKYLQNKNIEFKPWFLKEVLSNAIFMMINETLDKIDKNTMKNETCENGSIVQALLYFEKQYNFNYLGSTFDLLTSIKNYLDNNFKL